jgi:DNA-binding CsgD family transcriptional regulator
VRNSRAEREWLELTADALGASSTAFPEERIAEQLRRTFEARGVAFSQRSGSVIAQRLWPVDEQFNGHRAEIDRYAVQESAGGHPVLRCYLSTLECRPLQVHDVPETFADRRVMGAWLERAATWGAPAQMALPSYFAADGHRVFVLGRVDPFTRGELSLLHVLHGLLVGLDRQTAALRSVAATVDIAQATRLTVREVAVLGLVAEGLTAAAAARRLAVAEGTVHKHLQSIYRKLGVRDRLGAVLRAQHLGILRDANSLRRHRGIQVDASQGGGAADTGFVSATTTPRGAAWAREG